MNRFEGLVKILAGIVLAVVVMGCSQASDNAPRFDASKGKHPAGWMQAHWVDYTKSPGQCATCHGSATDPAKAGGTSKVSCFSCHPDGPGHPSGWSAAAQHGRLGAQAAPTDRGGFSACFRCHGSGPNNGLISTSCFSCHTRAPHPNKPWRSGSVASPNHDATDPANAPACHGCHAGAANSSLKPIVEPEAGAAPGCYNNTMCHSRNI